MARPIKPLTFSPRVAAMVSFLNGDGKYMPHSEAYELDTYEIPRTNYYQGTAEVLVQTALEMLSSNAITATDLID